MEITLIDMDSSSDEDAYVMDRSRLSELIHEERQKLIYVFEPLTERCFYMELREIIPGKTQEKPQVIKSSGNPPKQISLMEELDFPVPVPATARGLDEDEDFYNEFSDEDYNEEDLEDLSEGNPFEY